MASDETNDDAAGRPSGSGGQVATELDLDLDDEMNPDVAAAIEQAMAAVEGVEAAKSAGRADGAPDLAAENAALKRELEELRSRSMRTLADFDNFRKRNERERDEIRRYAATEAIREFVGVVDNLERALSAGGTADDLKRGVELIVRQMQEALRRVGVQEVAAQGAPFDPAVHEAVSREESAEVTAPTVIAALQRGYMLHDRLLRPAMVRVAVPVEKPGAPGAPAPEAGEA
ncbi:MAG TPA: nucleotide exchange factor GrpE [Thermoanaerobaculia bacterium]|jgi:molecular chaperone GrpE|nr:nucleotide exchange factor GrpE [Thermoanaerobaculia bacterium]